MAIILEKIPSTEAVSIYTPEEQASLDFLIAQVRLNIADDNANENILNKKQLTYTDRQIKAYLDAAVADINTALPVTKFTIFQLSERSGPMLIVKGAVVFCLIKEGLLQLKNQVDYNDSGLSVSMFNKTGQYQSWYSVVLNEYIMLKTSYKQTINTSVGGGFIGIGSQFGYEYARDGRYFGVN